MRALPVVQTVSCTPRSQDIWIGRMHNYPAESLGVQSRLHGLGLKPKHLMLIGSFVVAYGLFETTLERALWTLSETDVAGPRPFTEKLNSDAQFKLLGEGNSNLNDKCNDVLQVAAQVAADLNEYRNSLVHGYLLSYGAENTPQFMKNPGWNDVKRNKPVGDAYIDEPFQDLILIAAWTLFKVVQFAERSLDDPEAQKALEGLADDVNRARSYANETRHLCMLMNVEKN